MVFQLPYTGTPLFGKVMISLKDFKCPLLVCQVQLWVTCKEAVTYSLLIILFFSFYQRKPHNEIRFLRPAECLLGIWASKHSIPNVTTQPFESRERVVSSEYKPSGSCIQTHHIQIIYVTNNIYEIVMYGMENISNIVIYYTSVLHQYTYICTYIHKEREIVWSNGGWY